MTELSQEAKDILAEIRESNEAIKPVNSGLVKVENSNVIRSLEDYIVQHLDSEIKQRKLTRKTIANALH